MGNNKIWMMKAKNQITTGYIVILFGIFGPILFGVDGVYGIISLVCLIIGSGLLINGIRHKNK
jgi:hypothetical protein